MNDIPPTRRAWAEALLLSMAAIAAAAAVAAAEAAAILEILEATTLWVAVVSCQQIKRKGSDLVHMIQWLQCPVLAELGLQ